MYILKDKDELVNLVKNELHYEKVDELDVLVDLSDLENYIDEDHYVNESLLDSEVSIEVSVTDPEDELNDGDTYSIYLPLSKLIKKEY